MLKICQINPTKVVDKVIANNRQVLICLFDLSIKQQKRGNEKIRNRPQSIHNVYIK